MDDVVFKKEEDDMQKWEYAYIRWQDYDEPTLVYMYPTGEKIVTMEKEIKAGFFKGGDFWGQFKVWVVRLGQEGYEMVGIAGSAIGDAHGQFCRDKYEYWFKRPIQ